MKKFYKLLVIIVIVAVVAAGAILGTVYLTLRNASSMKEYALGSDVFRSVTALVGARKATGYAASAGTSGSSITLQYESDTVFDDLMAYTTYLTEEKGFAHTRDMSLRTVPGSTQLGVLSSDAGKIILVDIAYTDSRYTLEFTKGEGTLTPR